MGTGGKTCYPRRDRLRPRVVLREQRDMHPRRYGKPGAGEGVLERLSIEPTNTLGCG